ncbi:MAG: tetratricopeptide repeat protein [Candidatus Acidoferrales bacterium]
MDKSRREMLEEFIQQKPNDSFAHYGLAMEYANAGRHDDALTTFQKLLSFNPDYAYAYYHAGALLGKLGRVEEARSMFQRGLEVAGRTGDLHAKSELEEALHNLSG